mmetsp:Transcript_6966/g.15457  ORF Transcript_6966/g.15457 Transcript_6966/m.15457 type:complete len:233 (+) Transcript_6966:1049-1747(+)
MSSAVFSSPTRWSLSPSRMILSPLASNRPASSTLHVPATDSSLAPSDVASSGSSLPAVAARRRAMARQGIAAGPINELTNLSLFTARAMVVSTRCSASDIPFVSVMSSTIMLDASTSISAINSVSDVASNEPATASARITSCRLALVNLSTSSLAGGTRSASTSFIHCTTLSSSTPCIFRSSSPPLSPDSAASAGATTASVRVCFMAVEEDNSATRRTRATQQRRDSPASSM